jgi:hypothetical protein
MPLLIGRQRTRDANVKHEPGSLSASNTDVQPARSEAAFEMVALAASAGGLAALSKVLSRLPKNFPASIAIADTQRRILSGFHFALNEGGSLSRQAIRACQASGTNDDLLFDAINRRGRSIRCRITVTKQRILEEKDRGVILLFEEVNGQAEA